MNSRNLSIAAFAAGLSAVGWIAAGYALSHPLAFAMTLLIGAIYVADYATKAWTDAKKAFFVLGSQARGPMNEPNLPAFATREAADAHAKAQGGKLSLLFTLPIQIGKSGSLLM